ncbi:MULTISPECIES: hypothetical protein [unclassified Streptomyces]|uniref:hypothetical protein n=1 Tax=unclassified Streptomyces TaxID=2593676 RepID=UPI00332774B6
MVAHLPGILPDNARFPDGFRPIRAHRGADGARRRASSGRARLRPWHRGGELAMLDVSLSA